MTTTTHFDQLLHAASVQPEPQRLLFVFAGAELPPDATPAQREEFEAGRGGTLHPLACVDKGLEELTSFDALVEEAGRASPGWRVVFMAGLPGLDGRAPTAAMVDSALEVMVEGVHSGKFGGFLALDRSGEPLAFH